MTPLLSIQLRTFAASDPGLGGWQAVLDQAQAADAAGVDKVVVSDHVVFGENLEAYGRPELGGMAGGRQPTGPDGHWLEPTTILTAVGATTSHLRLANNILLAALRRPVILAKQLATLDVLTAGRVDLGVGVGWQAEEYEAAGLDFAERGRQLDHTLGRVPGPVDFLPDRFQRRPARVLPHLHAAAAGAARRGARVGERHSQCTVDAPAGTLRLGMDSLG